MNIIAFIPVRGGSKSIPLKNVKLFCGKPLIFWSLNALNKVDGLDKIYVATDSNTIKKTTESFSFDKVEIYDRDEKNAQDNSSTESVMLEFIEKKNISDDTIFILVQVTCPLTTAQDYIKAINLFKNDNVDSLLSVARVKQFLWNRDGTPINYDYKNRPRRQDFDGMLMENGAFYINTVKNIKRNYNRLCGKIAIFEMPEYTVIDIDEPDDWKRAEDLMQKYILGVNILSNQAKIKLFLTDVDGTLTDAGMYYDQYGNELKKFNTHDGKGFELIRKSGIKTGIITSEFTKIVENRAKKLNVDYLYQGLEQKQKLEVVKEICKIENISLNEVAYIGDDINCKELLENVGLAACPNDAVDEIKNIPKIRILKKDGGKGVVREFANLILSSFE